MYNGVPFSAEYFSIMFANNRNVLVNGFRLKLITIAFSADSTLDMSRLIC
ncbi:hypothetical protein B4086_5789 [Bacillus cereus]|nr:hypothetical protein B4086_5789 [Bacillus cereus]